MNNKNDDHTLNKICPLFSIAVGGLSYYCTSKCAWYVNYNDPNKSCCALVDISNVISELPTYLSHN